MVSLLLLKKLSDKYQDFLMSNSQKLISKEDIYFAGHRGMAGQSILKALKNEVYKYSTYK